MKHLFLLLIVLALAGCEFSAHISSSPIGDYVTFTNIGGTQIVIEATSRDLLHQPSNGWVVVSEWVDRTNGNPKFIQVFKRGE